MKQELFPVTRDQMQQAQIIECSVCGAIGRNTLSGHSKAGNEVLVAYFRRHGWDVDAKRGRHRCAECVAKATARERSEKEAKKMEKLTVVTPSQNSALAKKIMSDLLFEHYDMSAQDYKPGWDDARIAKEAGLSEAFVSARRASDYGPVSPPRRAVLREAAGMAEKAIIMGKDILEMSRVLEKKAETLLAETTRLAALIAEEAKKTAKAGVA